MSKLLPLLLFACCCGSISAAPHGAAATGQYRNLFREYLGKSDAEIAAKVEGAFQQLFFGDENSQRLFYPVPGDMAYVPDINNNDVRSEGLSYGMMIAVQMNRQSEFNQIWKFAKHYMFYPSGPLRGYFAWHTAFDGRRLSAGPAPDGEEWFVMALFFASHRWGDGEGIFNYRAEAQSLLRTMLHKDDEPDRGSITNMFDRAAKQINFTPHGPGATFTDPSYHLPAFYELWARWAADPADRAFLADATKVSRELFKKAAHPQTGLMPDYSEFDGSPRKAPWGNHEDFRYDAWRTLSNPALDHAWWAADPWQVEQSNRVLRFLGSHLPDIPDRFKIDGTPVSTDVNTPGLIAMAATAALAADRPLGEPFVQRLWDMPVPSGRLRYYDGLLTMIALLEVSGNFRIYGPQ
ncbi:MAG TPA: glycosyl hydrolase family 8 [Opitutus sp.]|nr:glycosyl hydrolase family 8 [Opitutus sp.]